VQNTEVYVCVFDAARGQIMCVSATLVCHGGVQIAHTEAYMQQACREIYMILRVGIYGNSVVVCAFLLFMHADSCIEHMHQYTYQDVRGVLYHRIITRYEVIMHTRKYVYIRTHTHTHTHTHTL
jgi:hypothetical protein